MKRAFTLQDSGHLVSDLVPVETLDALTINSRITVTRRICISAEIVLMPGEEGTVDHIDATSGLVEVLMDCYHKGLHAWDNHIWLQPFGTDDVIDGIRCVSSSLPKLQRVA